MKKLLAAAVILLSALMISSPAHADESVIPSLFAGDEAWYKDAAAPLIVRDGVNFVPAELFAMLDEVSISFHSDSNLLIQNSAGQYISILYLNRSAAVNGMIVEDISVFRSGDMYYVDAALAADALGLYIELHTLQNGGRVLRVSDEKRIFTLEELTEAYLPKNDDTIKEEALIPLPEEEEPISFDGKTKRIYVLVRTPAGTGQPEFSAMESCLLCGVDFTHFISDGISADELIKSSSRGVFGLNAPDADHLDALSEYALTYSRKTSRLTLSSGSSEGDRMLSERGYIPIVPDFTVNGTSNPDTLLPEIIQYIGKSGSCTLLLEDCWNSVRMAALLGELENSLYRTVNFSD